jgi:predicted nucleic acid-binding protein
VFIDANLLLEATLQDRSGAPIAQKFLATHPVVISPLTAHLFVHFGRKDAIPQSTLFRLLKEYRLTDFGHHEVSWAMANCRGDDFEDALQVACAVLHGCDRFATFDRTLATRYRSFIHVQVLR